jgi:DNA-binding HxlR family transcriptional regulator
MEGDAHGTAGAGRAGGAGPRDVAGEHEALARALDDVGDRWSLLLVEALLSGPARYGELRDALPGIAPNVLADRLRRLVGSGIARSVPYSKRPVRLEYALTADGRELAGVVRLLADWSARRSPGTERMRHAACGTPLEARWYCPTCLTAIDDAGDDAFEVI